MSLLLVNRSYGFLIRKSFGVTLRHMARGSKRSNPYEYTGALANRPKKTDKDDLDDLSKESYVDWILLIGLCSID